MILRVVRRDCEGLNRIVRVMSQEGTSGKYQERNESVYTTNFREQRYPPLQREPNWSDSLCNIFSTHRLTCRHKKKHDALRKVQKRTFVVL
jgi:hypothetical protein